MMPNDYPELYETYAEGRMLNRNSRARASRSTKLAQKLAGIEDEKPADGKKKRFGTIRIRRAQVLMAKQSSGYMVSTDQGEDRETGWVNRLFTRDGYTPEYQELKFTLHRKLLDRINLEALSSMAGERVRAEIRAAVAKLVEEEKTPLSLVEKDRVIEEILDEVFGLGPLEPLLQDPTVSDILVTTPQAGLRGTRRQAVPHAGGVQGRRAPAAHHRESRVARGPPRRRIVAAGGRAPARRLARQRRDSAGRGRWAAALDPPFRTARDEGRGPGREAGDDGRHAGAAEGLREGAPQHPDLRRNRRR